MNTFSVTTDSAMDRLTPGVVSNSPLSSYHPMRRVFFVDRRGLLMVPVKRASRQGTGGTSGSN